MCEKSRFAEIRRVFLAEWDPIGISGERAVEDEYDAYARTIETLLANRSPASKIADYLVKIEAGSMGLVAGHGRAECAAESLWSMGRNSR
ncbi:hypothetical protein [Mesorhizobium xinjiangense]|uniref:hypothetical protein n=1 Tax=Mesorhizobium xinjiangense TaxID=2678685 RepID=UPI0012ED2C7F|nr:hypothetical protein [Mesorhizobium xinjiangense]